MSAESANDLLTYREAAAYLGVGMEAVRNAVTRKALTPIKKPGIVTKFLRRDELDAYRRGEMREIARQRRGEVPRAAQPSPSSVARQAPEDMLRLAHDLAESGDEAMRDGLREHASGIIASRVAIIQTLLGNGSAYSDPKALVRSLIA